MKTAKLFRHGGSQAVRLPKAFRFEGSEVLIEKCADGIILKPIPAREFESFEDIAHYLAESFPEADEFPEPPPRPKEHERPVIEI